MSEVALPEAPAAAVSTPEVDAKLAEAKAIDGAENLDAKPEGETTAEAKPEKTPEQREIDRLRRGIDRRTRQLSDARAQLDLTRPQNGVNYQNIATDSEPLSLTRAQLHELVTAEALKLAPTLSEQATEHQRRESVVQSFAKTWGQEKFDEIASDVDEAFGGLKDSSGRPKPAIEAVFEADNPAKVLEWLADPDNIDEAERIGKLSAVQAGKAITKLELKLAEVKDKPIPSKLPPPLETIRNQGAQKTGQPDPKDARKWIQWRNEQEAKGLA